MWFTDNPWPPMLICGLIAAILFFVWMSRGRNLFLYGAIALLVACGVIYLAERSIVTPGEEVEARVLALCRAFQEKDPHTVDFISPNAPELRVLLATAMKMVDVEDDVRITDLWVTTSNNNSRAVSHFRANATVSVQPVGNVGHQPARLELTWQREGGEWHVVAVQRLNPINGEPLGLLEQRAE